ncbi:unnamed protein product [Camellia sinensis]
MRLHPISPPPSIKKQKRVKKAKTKDKQMSTPSFDEKDPEDSIPISKMAATEKRPASESTERPSNKRPKSVGPGRTRDITTDNTWFPKIQVGDRLLKVRNNTSKDPEVVHALTTGLLLPTDMDTIRECNEYEHFALMMLHSVLVRSPSLLCTTFNTWNLYLLT